MEVEAIGKEWGRWSDEGKVPNKWLSDIVISRKYIF